MPEADHHEDDRLHESGGHHYHRAHRAPGSTQEGDAPTAGIRSAQARESGLSFWRDPFSYSFTDPSVMPWMKKRWRNG